MYFLLGSNTSEVAFIYHSFDYVGTWSNYASDFTDNQSSSSFVSAVDWLASLAVLYYLSQPNFQQYRVGSISVWFNSVFSRLWNKS